MLARTVDTEHRPQSKFQVTVNSRVSGLVGHVVRAENAEAAALRALRSYPAGSCIVLVRPIGSEAAR